MKGNCAGMAGIALLVSTMIWSDARGIEPPATDWRKVPVVEIDMNGAVVTPYRVQLKQGSPVRLILRNMSGTTNAFFLGDFYTTLDWRHRLRHPGNLIRLEAMDSRELDVIPRKPGGYALVTTLYLRDNLRFNQLHGVIQVIPAVR